MMLNMIEAPKAKDESQEKARAWEADMVSGCLAITCSHRHTQYEVAGLRPE
jgi:hypothetical protein